MKDKKHAPITEHETTQVERANAAGNVPVVFVHGLVLPAAGIDGESSSRRTDTPR